MSESKPTKALTVRLPRDLVAQIEAIADAEDRSIAYITARLLRQALAVQKDARR